MESTHHDLMADHSPHLLQSSYPDELTQRFVLEDALDAVVEIDQESRVLSWNKQAELTFGWSKSEVLGQDLSSMIIPRRHREAHTRGLKHFLQTGEGPVLNHRIEITALHQDGREFPVELTIIPVAGVDGFHFWSFIRDISARRQAEQDLQQSRDQLRIIFESVADGIIGQDRSSRCVYANQAGAALCGYDSTEELMRASVLDTLDRFELLTEAGEPFPLNQLPARQVFEGVRSPPEVVIQSRNKRTGSRKSFSVTARPVLDQAGQPTLAVSVFKDITAQKEVEATLRKSEQQLRLITDSVPVSIGYVDRELYYRFVNEGYERYNQKPRAELLGRHMREMLGEEAFRERLPALNEALAGKRVKLEASFSYKHMGLRYLAYDFVPDVDEAGRVRGIFILINDITEYRQAQRALAESEEQFRTLAGSIPQLAWIAHADGHIFWYNERWYQYTGTTPSEMEGWGWQSVHDPQRLAGVMEAWTTALRTGTPFEMEFPIRREDGQFRWFLTRVIPVKNDQSQIVRWFGTNTDIHEQRRHREALAFIAEASSVLALSLDYAETLKKVAQLAVPRLGDWCTISVVEETGPERVAVAHPDPAMLAYAEEFTRLFPPDWQASGGQAQVLRSGVSQLYPAVTDAMLATTARSDDHLRLMLKLRMRSVIMVPLPGRLSTLGVLTLISSDPERRYTAEDLSVAEELGRRAGLAVENARLYSQAEAAIQARDEFLSIASHELKTPITSLKLQTQWHKRRLEKDDASLFEPKGVRKLIDVVDRQTERLAKLVDDMLDISRIAHGKLSLQRESVDLGLLVREVLDRLDEQLKAQGCRYGLQADGAVVGLWDRYRLEQVVINLLTNAMKYGDRKPVEISVRSHLEHAILTVKDLGMGIAPGNLERIFQRFERAISSENISGLGLGLYITRQIVEAHGGSIRVESVLGQGSTFTVELPLRPAID
jgi:PAS domain S-box-containing protein